MYCSLLLVVLCVCHEIGSPISPIIVVHGGPIRRSISLSFGCTYLIHVAKVNVVLIVPIQAVVVLRLTCIVLNSTCTCGCVLILVLLLGVLIAATEYECACILDETLSDGGGHLTTASMHIDSSHLGRSTLLVHGAA